MFENKVLVFSVLALIIVSLKQTYSITYDLASRVGYTGTQDEFGTGMDLTQPGFLLHIAVFAGIIMLLQKYGKM